MSATKTAKTPSVKVMARKRTVADRKAIVANVRKIERVREALEKAAAVIAKNGESITGDTGVQIAEILGKINIGVRITEAAVEAEALNLARTFVTR
jgi:hypothetical protein